MAAHRALAEAPSLVVVATLDDAVGMVDRPNMPGTIDEWPNWSHRRCPARSRRSSRDPLVLGRRRGPRRRGRRGPVMPTASVAAVMIEGLPLWLAQTNCWIVAPDGPGGECVIIDAPPDPTSILERLAHHELRLVALFNTHGHVDHVGGVAHAVHEPRARRRDRRCASTTPTATCCSTRSARAGMLGRYLEGLDLRPPELIYGLDDGERVSGAGMTFTAIHTPGHTQGSVCFRLDVEGEAADPVLRRPPLRRLDRAHRLPRRLVRAADGVDGGEDPADGRRGAGAARARPGHDGRVGAQDEPVPGRAPATGGVWTRD